MGILRESIGKKESGSDDKRPLVKITKREGEGVAALLGVITVCILREGEERTEDVVVRDRVVTPNVPCCFPLTQGSAS